MMKQNESKPTPEPWGTEYEEEGGYDCMYSAYVVKAGDQIVCVIDARHYYDLDRNSCYGEWAEGKANADLIVASPHLKRTGYMLAILSLQSDRYQNDPEFRQAVDDHLAAQAEAEGR